MNRAPDSRTALPLSWHASLGLGLAAFALLYMAQILIEAAAR
ncbi:MAG: hypothetical protein ACO1OX_07670 [Novosphingobium sp.]